MTIASLGAAFWSAAVTITSDPAHATDVEPVWSNGPNATFTFQNGYEVTTSQWGKSPGIISARIPPASEPEGALATNDGYPWNAAAAALGEERVIQTESHSTLAHLPNSTTYGLSVAASDLVNLDSALSSASFEVSTRKAPLGSVVVAHGDFESVLTTLSEAGVTSTLRMELYTPPSLGCRPDREWQIEASNLPGSGVEPILMWDAGGQDAVFVGAGGEMLYRINAAGLAEWSSKLSGAPTAIGKIDKPGSAEQLIVGTSLGKVQILDADDGDVRWTGSVGTGVSPVTLVAFDPIRELVIAASDAGAIEARALDRSLAFESSIGAGPVDVQAAPEGIYAASSTALKLFPQAAWTTPYSVAASPVGFTLTDTQVWFAQGASIRVVSRGNLHDEMTISLPAVATLATHGDVVGNDGIEDLVIAHDDLTISVASGAMESPHEFDNWPLHGVLSLDPTLGRGGLPAELMPLGVFEELACGPALPGADYQDDLHCGLETASGPVLLSASDGMIGIVFTTWGQFNVQVYEGTGGAPIIDDIAGATSAPRAIDLGAWPLADEAIAIGTADGEVRVVGPPTVLYPMMSSTPSDRVGSFTFAMRVPEGGFFGTHLLIARLSWEDAEGVSQEARLIDWFEVVDPDGNPVPNPSYRVALTVAPRDRPS